MLKYLLSSIHECSNQKSLILQFYVLRRVQNSSILTDITSVKHIKYFQTKSNYVNIQVPTQAPSEESGGYVCGGGGYSELLYAHLLDSDGARLTYTHYTHRVPYRHLQDIMFNRPVYIQKNKVTWRHWNISTLQRY